MKTALITGITGQDGSYLAELLLSRNGFDKETIIDYDYIKPNSLEAKK